LENFLLNFAAQIDVGRIVISPGVKNTLAALGKIGGGTTTSKVKQTVELDVKTIGRVSDLGSDLAAQIRKSLDKIKITPTKILDEASLSKVNSRLEQIPVIIKSINAAIAGIKAVPSIVPEPERELGRLSTLRKSLKSIEAEANKALKLQFSPELGQIRGFDSSIANARSNVKNLQDQLDKLKAAPSKSLDIQKQTEAANAAFLKMRDLRQQRAAQKNLSPDEKLALQAQEKEARDALAKIEARRASSKNVTQQIAEAEAKRSKGATAQFNLGSSLKAEQERAKQEIEKARARLEAEQLGLSIIQEQSAARSLTPEQTKKIQAKEAAISSVEAKKTEISKAFDQINKEIADLLDKERKSAQKVIDDYNKKRAEVLQQFKGKRKDLPARTKALEALEAQFPNLLEAQSAIGFSGFQPKTKKFQELKKKQEAAAQAFTESNQGVGAAKKELEETRASVLEQNKKKAVTKDVLDQQNKVNEAAKKLADIEKASQEKVNKLRQDYEALGISVAKAAEKKSQLEKLKSEGKTGLEGIDAQIEKAKKSLNEIQQKLVVSGESPKLTRAFQDARKEFGSALAKRKEALDAQKSVEQEILNLEKQINAQKITQRDLEIQQGSAILARSGNLKQDIALREKIDGLINKAIISEKNLQKQISDSYARVGKNAPQKTEAELRASALSRLGVSESEISRPTAQTLEKIKAARPSAAAGRADERVSKIETLDSQERLRVLNERIRALAIRRADTERINIESVKASGKPVGPVTPVSTIEESIRKSVFATIKPSDQASEVSAIRNVNTLIKEQVELRKEAIRLASQEKENRKIAADIEAKINNLVANENRNRGRIRTTFGSQGFNFDPTTGLAARVVAPGQTAPNPINVAGPKGTAREAVLSRLSISEDELKAGGAGVRKKIADSELRIAEERRKELESAKVSANRAVAAEDLRRSLVELIQRDLDLARRRAALSGGPAPSLAQSSARVLGNTFGTGTGPSLGTVNQAVTAFSAGSDAEAVAAIRRVSDARRRQVEVTRQLREEERAAAEAARNAATAQRTETDRRARAIERINALVERSTLLYERQIRASNALARSGVPGLPTQPVDQAALRASASRLITQGADLTGLSSTELANLERSGRGRLRAQQAELREFNSAVKEVSAGTRSAFELISKYSDNAFDRFGARVGLASERLAAYVISGAGLYSAIAATRQAIVETALLEKEITSVQQIFDTLGTSGGENVGLAATFDAAAKRASDLKEQVLAISQVTGAKPVEIAQSAKTLAAAGFADPRKSGFAETISAVSFATLGPSFGNSQEVIDGLIASINQFNRSLSETPYILGLVNQFSKDYAVEAQDLFESIKRGGGAFSAVGGNLEDFIKLTTIIRETTREAAPVIGTFIKTLSSRLYSTAAENLFGQLGIDTKQITDPYERLLELSRKLKGLGEQNVLPLLSKIVDSRQAGRFASLVKVLGEFDTRFGTSEEIRAKAVNSIAEDAKKRLDDIGPTIDRIRNSYFKFVENIYNNPATKALLDIPAGLLGALSEVPKLGFSVGKADFNAANFINPLAQGGAAIGIASVIRGSIRAFQQNGLSVRLNTASLEQLRGSVNALTLQMGGRAVAPTQAGGQAGRGGGIFAGFRGGGGGAAIALAGATLIPGLVNSILPALELEADTSSNIAAGVQGGVLAGVVARSLGAGLRGTAITAIVGTAVSAASSEFENRRQRQLLEEQKRQAEAAKSTSELFDIGKTGQIKKTDVIAPTKEARAFIDGVVKSDRFDKFKNLIPSLLLDPGLERNRVEIAKTEDLATKAAKNLNLDPDALRNGLEDLSQNLRTSLETALTKRLKDAPDTLEARKLAIKDVAKQFSEKVTIQGKQIDSEVIEKSLSDQFLRVNSQTRELSQSFGDFRVAVKSLYEESEIAGRILNTLGSTISRTVEIQNTGIQRVLDSANRSLASPEFTKRLTTNPFAFQTTQQLQQSASIRTVSNTISELSNIKPIDLLSSSIKETALIIDGFLNEISVATPAIREGLIRVLSDQSLRDIGGIGRDAEEVTNENRQTIVSQRVTNEALKFQTEQAFSALKELGPSSKKLFELITTSAPLGIQPFDLRELSKALTSGEASSGLRILGLQGAEQKLREQANLLIERQNQSIQAQIQASEALIAALFERRNNELESIRLSRDNQIALLGFSSTLGLVTKEFASAQASIIKSREISVREAGLPSGNISGISNTINLIKSVQNALNGIIKSTGTPGFSQTAEFQALAGQIAAINRSLPGFGLNNKISTSDIGKTAADLASSRALLERSIQEVFANLQDKFRNFGETVDLIGNKIQAQRATLDGIITKLFSGGPAERAIAKSSLTTAQQNVEKIIARLNRLDPNILAGGTGPNNILSRKDVADAISPLISSLSERDFTALRELISLAGSNQFTAGGTGEQIKAAIDAALSKILPTFGIAVGQKDIAANVSAGQAALNEANRLLQEINRASSEQANIMSGNLSLVSSEVSNLSAAIAAIPKKIELVVSGINNVSVDFDITDVQTSVSSIGQEVYKQIVQTLTEGFRRAGVPIQL